MVAGAGAVGLAVARALRLGLGPVPGRGTSRRGPRDVLVLEARARPGAGVSSRSSEVVHAGLYYAPGSLKARTCVEGARRLWQFCAERGVRARKLGKLVVAPGRATWDAPPRAPARASAPPPSAPSGRLEALAANARLCGASGLELLTAARARELEPALGRARGSAGGALLSRDSGIFDSHAFVEALAADVEGQGSSLSFSSSSSCSPASPSSSSSPAAASPPLGGGMIVSRAALVGGDLSRAGADGRLELLVRTAAGGGAGGGGPETVRVRADALVVAAGLGTARLLHGDLVEADAVVPGLRGWPSPEGLPPRAAFAYAKGNYFALPPSRGPSPFSRLLYPLPDPSGAGLGIHATLDLSGRTRFGPDVEWLGERETRELNGEGRSDGERGGGGGGGAGGGGSEIFGPEPGDVDPSRAALFDAAIRSYWPGLPGAGALRPEYAGVRPKLLPFSRRGSGGEGGAVGEAAAAALSPPSSSSDFFVAGARTHGARGVAVVAGIESPGLTASLALADEIVAALLEE